MKKYGDTEKLEVLRGHEAQALANFEKKVGKTLADFEKDEREELHKLLDVARKRNEEDDRAATEAAKPSKSDSDVDGGTASTGS